MSIYLFKFGYVPSPCNLFQSLSLTLRSHDQFQTSHWSTPLPPLAETPLAAAAEKTKIGATIRIGREILCLPYAGFLHESVRGVSSLYI